MQIQRLLLIAVVCLIGVSLIGCASSKRVVMDDQSIANQIKSQLEAPEGPQGPFSIDIFVHKGEVTLDGTVPNNPSKEQAMQISQGTEGVTNVKSFLISQ